MAFDQTARRRLEAYVELCSQICRCADLGLPLQKRYEQVIGDKNKKPDGELVGFDFLALVLSGGPGLAHVPLGAGKRSAQSKRMPFQQEMSKLVRDAEPRRLRPAPTVDQNLSMAADAVSEQDALAAIKFIAPDLCDPEGQGDLVDRNGAGQTADLLVQRLCKSLWQMNVGEIDTVKLQGATPAPWVWPASTSPSPR